MPSLFPCEMRHTDADAVADADVPPSPLCRLYDALPLSLFFFGRALCHSFWLGLESIMFVYKYAEHVASLPLI